MQPINFFFRYDFVKNKTPAFSMASRFNIPTDINQKPGPGSHRPEKLNLGYVPSYSFGIKHSAYLGGFRDKVPTWRSNTYNTDLMVPRQIL